MTDHEQWSFRAYDCPGPLEVKDRGTLDEFLVDHWLHVECMDEGVWLMRIGEQTYVVTVDPNGEVGVDETRAGRPRRLPEGR